MSSYDTFHDCPVIDMLDYGDHTSSRALFWESHMTSPDESYYCTNEPSTYVHATVLA